MIEDYCVEQGALEITSNANLLLIIAQELRRSRSLLTVK
jgi:hypothetical protein